MTKAKWKKEILAQMKDLGIYRESYEGAIKSLAEILEQRDKTAAYYRKSGANPVVEYTNKNGSTNLVKNPALTLWDELNKSALAYWRELGLTPTSYKKMAGASGAPERRSALADALASLDGG